MINHDRAVEINLFSIPPSFPFLLYFYFLFPFFFFFGSEEKNRGEEEIQVLESPSVLDRVGLLLMGHSSFAIRA